MPKTETKQKVKQVTEGPWIDGAFRVEKCCWGTWVSYAKDEEKLVTSLTEELCIEATRFYLKGRQEGFPESSGTYNGEVGGKL